MVSQSCPLRVICVALAVLPFFMEASIGAAAEPGDRQARRRAGAAAHALHELGARITRRGGATVGVDLQGEVSAAAALPCLRDLPSVETLDLSDTDFADDDLAALAGMTNLTALDLTRAQVTGRGLAALSALNGLEQLSLAGTPLEDEQMQAVAELKELRALDLSQTSLSNDGLIHLKDMSKLQTLGLRGTKVTDDGVDVLFWLPDLRDFDCRDTRLTEWKVRCYFNDERWLISQGLFDTDWPYLCVAGRMGDPKLGEDKIVLYAVRDRERLVRDLLFGTDNARIDPWRLTIYTRRVALIFEDFDYAGRPFDTTKESLYKLSRGPLSDHSQPYLRLDGFSLQIVPPGDDGPQTAADQMHTSWLRRAKGLSAGGHLDVNARYGKDIDWKRGKFLAPDGGHSAVYLRHGRDIQVSENFYARPAVDPERRCHLPWIRVQFRDERYDLKIVDGGRKLIVNDRHEFDLGYGRKYIAVSANGAAREL